MATKKATAVRREQSGLCRFCEAKATHGRLCGRHVEIRQGYRDRARVAPRKKLLKRRDLAIAITDSSTELAYAAGVIDGEGCIFFAKGSRTSSSVSLMVQVSMTCELVIKRLHTSFGGSLGEKNWKKYQKQFRWMVSGDRAYAVLTAISPYLTGKIEQCRLGMKTHKLTRTAPRAGYRNQQHVPETVAFLQYAFDEMKRLKKFGGR